MYAYAPVVIYMQQPIVAWSGMLPFQVPEDIYFEDQAPPVFDPITKDKWLSAARGEGINDLSIDIIRKLFIDCGYTACENRDLARGASAL